MTQKSNRGLRGRRRTRRKGKSSSSGFRKCQLSLEMLEQRQLLSANPIISEFMASNSTTLKDYYGKYPDWLEIYNPNTDTLDLSGWKLQNNSTVWTIPANVTISGMSYLTVFCDSRDTIAANGELHANFKLGASGDYLGLLAPDNTVVSEYSPEYPQQYADISYGLVWQEQSTSIISSGATAKVLVPTSSNGGSSLGTTWEGSAATEPFDDSSWLSGTTGVGMTTTVTPVASTNLKLRLNSNTLATIVTDTSGASHNATNGGASWVSSSTDTQSESMTRSGALQFNASENDRMFVTGNTDFYNASQGAIMFWMRSGGTYGTSGDGALLVDYRTSSGMQISQTNAGQIRVRVYSASIAANDVLSNATVSDNQWHHVTVTFNRTSGGVCAIYIDGVLDNQGANSTSWTWGSSSYPFEIGRTTVSHTPSLTMKNYHGLLDDIRFYNASLTTTDIDNIAKGTDETVSSTDVGLNVTSQMQNVNSSAFIRIPFTITDVGSIDNLLLSLRFNDGFIAWINGVQVAAVNAPESPAWNSAATGVHTPNMLWRGLIDDVSDLLQTGTNILAIQGLNYSASDPSFLILPQLSCNVTSIFGAEGKYFVAPTPGETNGTGSSDLGPIVTDVSEPTTQPAAGAAIIVTAQVTQTLNPIQSDSVTLHYRAMYNTEYTVPMYDDGTHNDSVSGDGIYTGTIPAGAATAGQMLRWYVTATDTLANSGRWPVLVPIIGNDGGPEYMGTVIADSTLTSTLPIFQSFIVNTSAADNWSDRTGSRASVYYLGRFYDNVFVYCRGGYTTNGNKFKFNSGYDFTFAEDQDPVKTINLNQAGWDESYARPKVAFETMSEAGVPASIVFPIRVQRNNAYYGVMNFIEQVNNQLLKREGIYENGAIYKGNTDYMSNSSSAYFTKLNRDEVSGTDDLQQFLNGLHLSDLTARRKFIYDNVNIPVMLDYLAATTLVLDNDHVAKNYYIYCDTNDGANAIYNYANADGTNEWAMIPWDKDLTFGKSYGFTDYSIPDPYAHPFFGDSDHPKIDGPYNWLIDSLLDIPEIKQMYLRRLRTLMDELLQPLGTAYANRNFESKFDAIYAALMGDPVVVSHLGNLSTAYNNIKNLYLDPRRTHLYVDHSQNTSYPDYAGIPAAQADSLIVNFGTYEVSPASGNQDQEYLTLVNPTSVAIDLSGWKLQGGIELTFKDGVVIPAGGTLYVSPNVYAFRHRTTGPSGSQGLLVQGNYKGRLSQWGETIQLLDTKDNVVATLTTSGSPSLAQQYLRITEVMYHPADPTSGSYMSDDFQFIELRNTSATQTLSLSGVRFTDGVTFDFTGSNVTSLAPGAKVLVVSNLAAFQSRYGTSFNGIIAGQFAKARSTDLGTTHLAKSGEKLTLVDATGETVLSFSYQDGWYKQTDGSGNSLVIRAAAAVDRDLWDQREGWFASHAANGSPGADETATYAADVIIVNELLAHRTDEPGALGDWVEFYNITSSPIDIGGWYLSNSDDDLKKFQIPAGTVIPAHGYKAFNWRDNFGSTANAGCITPFTFGELGGDVYLTSAVAGVLTDFQANESFGSSDTGVTFGRYIKSTGGKDFVATSSPTYELPNSSPAVGPVVINEIYYHPTAGKDAFIEIKNTSNQTVLLYDSTNPQNTWHLAEGVEITFPTGASILANGCALIVNINPAYFRTKYSIPASVPIYGPYLFELDKSGDTIELKYPDDPQPDGDVPYDRMDQVTYEDGGLWPKTADGFGTSLNRIVASAYGNDVANWTAGQPTPGASNLIASSTPNPAGPTNADSLTFTVVFCASVVNVSSDDFVLTSTGTAAGTIVGVTPSSGTTFTVTIGSIVGDGTLRLDLKDGTNVQDTLGNKASGYRLGSTVSIDNTIPTTSIAAVTPNPRVSPVDSIAIHFSEPIVGLGIEDLQFARDGLSLSLNGATLTTSDQQNWILGNLSALTSPAGNYLLTLSATGSGIADLAGNGLATGANTFWHTSLPLAGDFNTDGTVDMLDYSVLRAHLGMVSGATFAMGDANRDGAVNLIDYNLWKATLGQVFLGAPSLASPTTSIVAVTPTLRITPVASIAIQFSEPVVGLGIEDLQLTLGGQGVSLSGATLTTTDWQNWTLGSLSTITAPVGNYQLTLVATASGITDFTGIALTVGADTVWQTSLPLAGDFNSDGTVDMTDLGILKAHINMKSGATFAMGDANRDGAVNVLDYNLWKATFGQTFPGNGSVTPLVPAPLPSLSLPASSASAALAATSSLTSTSSSVVAPAGNATLQASTASASRDTSKSTAAATVCLSNALLPTAALQAAHDAVFSQLDKGCGSAADGLLGDRKLVSAFDVTLQKVSGVFLR
jgi:hypothetical protein